MKFRHIEILDALNILEKSGDVLGSCREAALFALLANRMVYFWRIGWSQPTPISPFDFMKLVHEYIPPFANERSHEAIGTRISAPPQEKMLKAQSSGMVAPSQLPRTLSHDDTSSAEVA